MRVHIDQEPRAIVASIEGRFEAASISSFEEVVDRVTPELPNVIVDLSAVDFMDSSALTALVRTHTRTAAHHGSVVLANVSRAAQVILQLTRLDEVLRWTDTLAEARELIAAPA